MNETEQKILNEEDFPIDPFAVDIFGTKSSFIETVLTEESEPVKTVSKNVRKSNWSRNLPRLTNQEVIFSASIENIPEGISEATTQKIIEAIARYTFRQPEKVGLLVMSVAEINLSEAVGKLKKSPKVLINLAAKPNNSAATIAVDTEFAVSIIDLILGGKGAEFFHPKKLSPIETSIFKFLTLNILRETNEFFGASVLSLQSISNENELNFTPSERGIEIVVNLELDEYSGIISLIIPRYFLLNFDKLQNPLLRRKSKRKAISLFEKFIPGLPFRLQIGTTTLDAESLSFLEPNDIVLLENSAISLNGVNFSGKLKVFLGSGKNFRLEGKIEENNNDNDTFFKIDTVLSEETRRRFTPTKFKMDEQEIELNEKSETEVNETEISASLENLQVTLRVEIAGNKINLRELQNLHSGQIIALGCRPTDPVRLVTDNNDEPVASGELVEIEGQLGVRLTKVFI